jgi:hypothetical protein
MEANSILSSLFAPAILFFALGMISVLVRSDLEIPPPVVKFCAIFLLLSIGLEGGIEAVEAVQESPDLPAAMAMVAAFGIVVSILTVVFSQKIFRVVLGFKTADAWATAGLYSAVSSVTLMVAVSMARAAQDAVPEDLIYNGWMVATNVFLDAPGIIAAIVLGRMALLREAKDTSKRVRLRGLLRDSVFGWAIWLMMGGLVVGILSQTFSPSRMADTMQFFGALFHGVLSLYLLELGMVAAKRIGELKEYGTKLVRTIPVAWILPQIWALMAIAGIYAIHLVFPGTLGWGDAFVFAAMAGSASYISAPPALRAAIPEANPAVYLPMALVLTFPFNIIVSLPLWLAVSQALWG